MNPSFQGTMLREAAETLARAQQGKVQGKVDRFRRRKDLKRMVGRDGIEPPTPGFSVLFSDSRKCAQLLATQSLPHRLIVRPSALE